MVILMVVSSGCDALKKVDELKEEAGKAMESLDDIKDDVEDALLEAEEAIEDIEEDMAETSGDEDTEVSAEDDNHEALKDDSKGEMRDISDAIHVEYDMFMVGTLEPGEKVSYYIEAKEKLGIGYNGVLSVPLTLTYREVMPDEDADGVIMYYGEESNYYEFSKGGDGLLEFVNNESEACNYKLIISKGGIEEVDAVIADLGGLPIEKENHIEYLVDSVFGLTNIMGYVEDVRLFESDEAMGLPEQPNRNYIYIKGSITNISGEIAHGGDLFEVFIYDNLGNQCANATKWLEDGEMSVEIGDGGEMPYQVLFVFDKEAEVLDFEFFDWPSREKVTSTIDVTDLNVASRADDEAENANVLDTIDALSDEILMLIDEDRFGGELEDKVYSEVYFMPAPSVGHDSAVYLGLEAWSMIEEYETELVWGGYNEGKGDAIELTPMDYFDAYITSHDFTSAPEKMVKSYEDVAEGFAFWKNDINGGDYFVEYHYPGFKEEFEGMDYQTLYMIFTYDEENEKYLLTGIANEYWTI